MPRVQATWLPLTSSRNTIIFINISPRVLHTVDLNASLYVLFTGGFNLLFVGALLSFAVLVVVV